ncbi:hypothetical protein F4780DRAFT_720700 [Xylariomycetidae sp. FL0641]|nr:hypothetical protein F4780DRAFT_720700 [Xylariomycetidae sp. FL0641]
MVRSHGLPRVNSPRSPQCCLAVSSADGVGTRGPIKNCGVRRRHRETNGRLFAVLVWCPFIFFLVFFSSLARGAKTKGDKHSGGFAGSAPIRVLLTLEYLPLDAQLLRLLVFKGTSLLLMQVRGPAALGRDSVTRSSFPPTETWKTSTSTLERNRQRCLESSVKTWQLESAVRLTGSVVTRGGHVLVGRQGKGNSITEVLRQVVFSNVG